MEKIKKYEGKPGDYKILKCPLINIVIIWSRVRTCFCNQAFPFQLELQEKYRTLYIENIEKYSFQ